MKKIFLTLSITLLSIVGFANNKAINNDFDNSLKVESVEKNPEIKLNYTFDSVESLKAFDFEKIGELDFSSYDNGEDTCEVTGSVSVTVEGEVSNPLVGSISVSVTITLEVTASCSEIAGALKDLAATARSIAISQLN
jgi:protein involved in polysaccharide export with SLBB domain